MLYYLFQYLESLNVPGAGMFQYISFRAGLAVIITVKPKGSPRLECLGTSTAHSGCYVRRGKAEGQTWTRQKKNKKKKT